MTNPDYRALCAELVKLLEVFEEWSGCTQPQALTRVRAALAEQLVEPTDEELIRPIMWMLDDSIYDNDKGEIAQSLRELVARWGQP
jgi:hypothetical protein